MEGLRTSVLLKLGVFSVLSVLPALSTLSTLSVMPLVLLSWNAKKPGKVRCNRRRSRGPCSDFMDGPLDAKPRIYKISGPTEPLVHYTFEQACWQVCPFSSLRSQP
jgi:hypothetical protein